MPHWQIQMTDAPSETAAGGASTPSAATDRLPGSVHRVKPSVWLASTAGRQTDGTRHRRCTKTRTRSRTNPVHRSRTKIRIVLVKRPFSRSTTPHDVVKCPMYKSRDRGGAGRPPAARAARTPLPGPSQTGCRKIEEEQEGRFKARSRQVSPLTHNRPGRALTGERLASVWIRGETPKACWHRSPYGER